MSLSVQQQIAALPAKAAEKAAQKAAEKTADEKVKQDFKDLEKVKPLTDKERLDRLEQLHKLS